MQKQFAIGDGVISNSKYSKGEKGIVYKIYEYGVSVRFNNGLYQVFHYTSTHHMQSSIEDLQKLMICFQCHEDSSV